MPKAPGHSSVFDEDHRSALAAPADRLKEQSRAQKQKAPIARGLSNEYGGDEGDRTLDLRIANATLSQLSYRPTRVHRPRMGSGRRGILKTRDGSGKRNPVILLYYRHHA